MMLKKLIGNIFLDGTVYANSVKERISKCITLHYSESSHLKRGLPFKLIYNLTSKP